MQINYSFIIPHKNRPKLLERCLASIPIRNDIEIIIVDDNSYDAEKPVVARSDTQVYYLDAKESNGPGKARNIGLEHAQGKWILFADSDDYYEKNFIEKLDVYKDSAFDMVFFDVFWAYSNGSTGIKGQKYSEVIRMFLLKPNNLQCICLKHFSNAVWSRMYSRSFLMKNHVRFAEKMMGEDGCFVHYASSLTNNIVAIKDKLYFYVKNESSLVYSRPTERIVLDGFYAGAEIRKFLISKGCGIALGFQGLCLGEYLKILRLFGVSFFLKCLFIHYRYDVSFFVRLYWKIKVYCLEIKWKKIIENEKSII